MKTKTFLLALLAQLFTLTASAYDAKVGSLYYNLDNTNRTAEVTHSSTYTGGITIPTNITYNNVNYRVTVIGYEAFENCTGLTSVSIPSSIKTIGAWAFSGCTQLTSITIPASVTEIHGKAFSGCTQLASITIPASVIYIDFDAFLDTPWYDTWYANQADGFCYINNVLYKYKGSMPHNYTVNVPDGTTCIGGRAFEGQTNLVSVVIPESCTYIGAHAFYQCSSLKSITWPSSLDLLGGAAFGYCSSLEHVDIPMCSSWGNIAMNRRQNGVVEASTVWHFVYCNNLVSATFAEGINSIPKGFFSICTNLNYVSLPSTITDIYHDAFSGCNNLTTVKIEKRVPITIDSEVFTNRFVSTLIVPEGCKAAYEAADYWQDFATIVEESAVPEADIQFYTTPLETKANTQVTLSVNLSNSVTVQGFSFDLALPEGVAFALDEDDIEMVTLSTERTTTRKTNVFDFYTNTDGSLHVEASSTRGYTLDGEDGEVVQVVVNIAKGTEDGDYPLTFSNITVTDGDGNDYHPEASTSTLTVLPKDPFDLNDDGEVDIADVTLLVNRIIGR